MSNDDEGTQAPVASAGGRWLIEPLGKSSIFTVEQLTSEQLAFAETASAFVEGEVLPRQTEIDTKKPDKWCLSGLLFKVLRSMLYKGSRFFIHFGWQCSGIVVRQGFGFAF